MRLRAIAYAHARTKISHVQSIYGKPTRLFCGDRCATLRKKKTTKFWNSFLLMRLYIGARRFAFSFIPHTNILFVRTQLKNTSSYLLPRLAWPVRGALSNTNIFFFFVENNIFSQCFENLYNLYTSPPLQSIICITRLYFLIRRKSLLYIGRARSS